MKNICGLLVLLISIVPNIVTASSGPEIKEIEELILSTWAELEIVSKCANSPLESNDCLKKLDGQTIQFRSFGVDLNALILFSVQHQQEVTGEYFVEEKGFLIGPIQNYGYRIIITRETRDISSERVETASGLRVFAHKIGNDNYIFPERVELTINGRWDKGGDGEWIYHWSYLNDLFYSLKSLRGYLKQYAH